MTDEKWKSPNGHPIRSDVTDANPSAYTAQPDHIYVGIDFSNKDSVCCAIRRGDLTVSISYDNEAREYIKSIIEAQQQPDAELLEALKEAWSVVSSINYGKNHAIKRSDGEVLYGQTDDWCIWALKEVLPKMEQAITRAEQKGGKGE